MNLSSVVELKGAPTLACFNRNKSVPIRKCTWKLDGRNHFNQTCLFPSVPGILIPIQSPIQPSHFPCPHSIIQFHVVSAHWWVGFSFSSTPPLKSGYITADVDDPGPTSSIVLILSPSDQPHRRSYGRDIPNDFLRTLQSDEHMVQIYQLGPDSESSRSEMQLRERQPHSIQSFGWWSFRWFLGPRTLPRRRRSAPPLPAELVSASFRRGRSGRSSGDALEASLGLPRDRAGKGLMEGERESAAVGSRAPPWRWPHWIGASMTPSSLFGRRSEPLWGSVMGSVLLFSLLLRFGVELIVCVFSKSDFIFAFWDETFDS